MFHRNELKMIKANTFASKLSHERDETDSSLTSERGRTDESLTDHRLKNERETDEIVKQDRQEADEIRAHNRTIVDEKLERQTVSEPNLRIKTEAQQATADRLQVQRQLRIQQLRHQWHLHLHRVHDGRQAISIERRHTREAVVKHRPQTIHVLRLRS